MNKDKLLYDNSLLPMWFTTQQAYTILYIVIKTHFTLRKLRVGRVHVNKPSWEVNKYGDNKILHLSQNVYATDIKIEPSQARLVVSSLK